MCSPIPFAFAVATSGADGPPPFVLSVARQREVEGSVARQREVEGSVAP